MDMKAFDAQCTVENRLEQAFCTVTAMLGPEDVDELTPRVMAGVLWTLQELVGQAREAFQEMCQQRKPATPVMCNGEPIPDLEYELISVMREMTKVLEDTASTGRDFLNDIDKRDKANEAPGGGS